MGAETNCDDVVVINGDTKDSHAARNYEDAFDLANPGSDDAVNYCIVRASDAGEARLLVQP